MDIKNLIEAERLIYASVILPLLVQIMAIIRTNAEILLTEHLGTNFSEILMGVHTFDTLSFKKMHLKMSSGKWRPSCLGLRVLSGFQPLQYTFTNPIPPYGQLEFPSDTLYTNFVIVFLRLK